jgi:hypothetical protein
MECHARRPDGTQDYVNSWGKGGYEFKDVWGVSKVSNITSQRRYEVLQFSFREF